jgi:hypothetical protein
MVDVGVLTPEAGHGKSADEELGDNDITTAQQI